MKQITYSNDKCKETLIQKCSNGVKLIRNIPNKTPDIQGTTIDQFLEWPYHVYLLDLEGRVIKTNDIHANAFGHASAKALLGKSAFDVLDSRDARVVRENDRRVMVSHQSQIIDEDMTYTEPSLLQAISFKAPCYNDYNQIIGILSFSMLIGRDTLAEFLSHLNQLGFLSLITKNKYPFSQFSNSMVAKGIYLSKREKECLYYLLRGQSAREIGLSLSLSKRTIETHLQNIKIKCEVNSKSELMEMFFAEFFDQC